jgi:hypothetical protein
MNDGPEQVARDKLFLRQLGKEISGTFPSRWYSSTPYEINSFDKTNLIQDMSGSSAMDLRI